MSQKEAIFKIVKEILGPLYSPSEGMRPYFGNQHTRNDQTLFPRSQEGDYRMKLAVTKLVKLIEEGKVDYDSSQPSQKYARNIIFNWLKKDPRLNGGVTYRPSTHKSKKHYFEALAKKMKPENPHLIEKCLEDQGIQELLHLHKTIKGNTQESQMITSILIDQIIKICSELRKRKVA